MVMLFWFVHLCALQDQGHTKDSRVHKLAKYSIANPRSDCWALLSTSIMKVLYIFKDPSINSGLVLLAHNFRCWNRQNAFPWSHPSWPPCWLAITPLLMLAMHVVEWPLESCVPTRIEPRLNKQCPNFVVTLIVHVVNAHNFDDTNSKTRNKSSWYLQIRLGRGTVHECFCIFCSFNEHVYSKFFSQRVSCVMTLQHPEFASIGRFSSRVEVMKFYPFCSSFSIHQNGRYYTLQLLDYARHKRLPTNIVWLKVKKFSMQIGWESNLVNLLFSPFLIPGFSFSFLAMDPPTIVFALRSRPSCSITCGLRSNKPVFSSQVCSVCCIMFVADEYHSNLTPMLTGSGFQSFAKSFAVLETTHPP